MSHYLEQELLELVQQDSTIFEFLSSSAMDGLWYWDLERPEEEYMNPRFWEILGYDHNKMPHSPSAWQGIIHPDDMEGVKEALDLHFSGPELYPFEQIIRYRHKKGHTVYIKCRGRAILNHQGQPIRMLGVHMDISREIEASRESENFFQLGVDLMCVANTDGYFLKINHAFHDALGYSEEELLSVNFLQLIHPEDLDLTRKALADLSQQKSVTGLINRYRTKEGNYIFLKWSARPMGGISYAIAQDITEEELQKRAEARAKALQSLLLDLSGTFQKASSETYPEAVQYSLEKLGKFLNADRTYVIDYDYSTRLAHNSYEWCADGISPEIENLQNVPMDMVPEFLQIHEEGKPIYIPDVLALPDSGTKAILEPQGIKSMVAVPLMAGALPAGFVGFDSVSKHRPYDPEELVLLQHFALNLTNLMLRIQNERNLYIDGQITRKALEQLPEPVIITDELGNILEANPSFIQICACMASEVKKGNFKDLGIFEELTVETIFRITADSKDNVVRQITTLSPLDNSSPFVVQLEAQKMEGMEGTSARWIIHIKDMRDVSIKEAELEEQRRLISRTHRTAKVGGWEIDKNSDTVLLTPMAAEMLDCPQKLSLKTMLPSITVTSPERAAGISIWQYIHKLASGNHSSEDVVQIRVGNQSRWFRISLSEKGKSDEADRYLGVIQDVSGSRFLEEQLIESQEWLKLSQTIGQIGHFLIDLDTGKWESSPALDEIVGILAKDPRTIDSWMEYVLPEYREPLNREFQNAISKTGKMLATYPVYNAIKKRNLFIEVNAQLEKSNNGRRRLIGTVQDVDDIIRYLNTLEKQIQVFKDIAWTQSHIVRAPLARILSLLEMLEANQLDMSPAERARIFSYLSDSGKELDSIISKTVFEADAMRGANTNRIMNILQPAVPNETEDR
jgi:PAS domain S-box-containing protein